MERSTGRAYRTVGVLNRIGLPAKWRDRFPDYPFKNGSVGVKVFKNDKLIVWPLTQERNDGDPVPQTLGADASYRITLPAPLMEALGWSPGDPVVMRWGTNVPAPPLFVRRVPDE